MKMNKVLVALLLVVTLAMSACGQGTPAPATEAAQPPVPTTAPSVPAQKTVLQFWAFQSGTEQEYMKKFVDQYNASQDKVTVEITFLSQADYMAVSIPTAYANGNAPDIFFMDPGNFQKYAGKGLLADLTPSLPADIQADYQPAILESAKYNGKIVALPYEMDVLGLFYNADVLKQAGITPPTTWTELYNAAKALTTKDRFGIVLPVANDGYTVFSYWPFMFENGGSVLSPDGTKSVFNSPENAEELTYISKFFTEGLAPKTLQLYPTDIGNLATGVAAMQVTGTWNINAIETTYKDVNIGVVPIPHPDGKDFATVGGGQKLVVNAKSQHVQESIDFITWLFGGSDVSRLSEWCTQAKFSYPVRYSAIKQVQDVYNKGLRAVFTNQIFSTIRPEPSYSPDVSAVVQSTEQQVFFGGVSAADALKSADDQINEALKK